MTEVTTPAVRRSTKVVLATMAIVAMLTVAACSSETKSTTDGTTVAADTTTETGGDKGDGEPSKSASGTPDGFPDIPLPEFTDAKVIKDGSGSSPGWSVLFTVDETLEKDKDAIVTEYADQLRTAGYEIEGDATDPSIKATKDGMFITFHSSMAGTITIGVMEP